MNFYIECVFCGKIERIYASDVEELLDILANKGYIITSVFDDDVYTCPACAKRNKK